MNSDLRILKQAAQRLACEDLFARCSVIAAAMRCAEHQQPPGLIINEDKIDVQTCCVEFRKQVEEEITLKTGNKPIRIEEFRAKYPPTASA